MTHLLRTWAADSINFMADSRINWKLVAYAVGGCWLIFAVLYLLGLALRVPFLALIASPFPIVAKAIFGGLVYGYVGSTRKHDLEAVFVYWTLLGLVLSWLLHKSKRKPTFIIGMIAVVHIVLSVLTFFPMVLLGGR